MLKGSSVSLDNLLGYSRLQEVLEMLLKHLNDQDTTIAMLVKKTSGLASVPHAVETLQRQVQGQVGSLGELRAEVDALQASKAETGMRMDGLEARMDKVGRDSRSLQQSVEQRLSAVEQALSDLKASEQTQDGRLQALERDVTTVQETSIAELQRQLDELRVTSLPAGGAGISSEDLEKVQAQLRDLLKRHNVLEGRLESWAATSTSRERVAQSAPPAPASEGGATDERLRRVESSLDDLAEQLSHLSEDGTGSGKETRPGTPTAPVSRSVASTPTTVSDSLVRQLSQDMLSLREELQAQLQELSDAAAGQAGVSKRVARLEEAVSSDVQPSLGAIIDKEARDVSNLEQYLSGLEQALADLRAQVAAMSGPKGSSATSRCLTCYDRRHQLQDRYLNGSDGKVYKDGRPPSRRSARDLPDPVRAAELSGAEPASEGGGQELPRLGAGRQPSRGGAGSFLFRHARAQSQEPSRLVAEAQAARSVWPSGQQPFGAPLGKSSSTGRLDRGRPQTASSGASTAYSMSRVDASSLGTLDTRPTSAVPGRNGSGVVFDDPHSRDEDMGMDPP